MPRVTATAVVLLSRVSDAMAGDIVVRSHKNTIFHNAQENAWPPVALHIRGDALSRLLAA